jgi:hypothetical protein
MKEWVVWEPVDGVCRIPHLQFRGYKLGFGTVIGLFRITMAISNGHFNTVALSYPWNTAVSSC